MHTCILALVLYHIQYNIKHYDNVHLLLTERHQNSQQGGRYVVPMTD